jgi:hypothetical protein
MAARADLLQRLHAYALAARPHGRCVYGDRGDRHVDRYHSRRAQEARMIQARFTRASICKCGFPILNPIVPLGTIYSIDPDNIRTQEMICGGCGRRISGTWCYVAGRGTSNPGYLPRDIFTWSQ